MTIEFDDAGGGCPILGEVFVVRRIETNEYHTIYLENQNKIKSLNVLLKLINPHPNEQIILCRGNVFDQFANHLIQKEYNVNRSKIEGTTNDIAESTFLQKLRNIGLPMSVQLNGKNYGQFYSQVMMWYNSLYEGKHLINTKRKLKPVDFVINRVYTHVNLMEKLFLDEEITK